MVTLKDRFAGSLILSAAGDALGYTVEFLPLRSIIKRYGEDGIQEYDLSYGETEAVFSDDTQMTLFTAQGLLFAQYGGKMPEREYVWMAYQDWLLTQGMTPVEVFGKCSLLQYPGLHHRRAPGNTCLSALTSGEIGTMERPINHSKGCGGVMRVSPCAMVHRDRQAAALSAAEAAAITHTHPMGYIPCATLAFILNSIIYEERTDLREVTEEALRDTQEMFADCAEMPEYIALMHRAMRLSENDRPDAENIEAIGGGWVGDEALAIAVYCVLKYAEDPDRLLIAAVNHSGDSDSTGAIAGGIAGALLGLPGIPEKWIRSLEMTGVLLQIADDLYAAVTEPKKLQGKYCMGKR